MTQDACTKKGTFQGRLNVPFHQNAKGLGKKARSGLRNRRVPSHAVPLFLQVKSNGTEVKSSKKRGISGHLWSFLIIYLMVFMDVRPASCYLYLPCRTAQVLAPAELLEGGIRVWLDSKLLKDRAYGL